MKKYITLILAVLISSISFAQQKKYVSYKVKEGETMKKIAKRYDLKTRELLQLNPGVDRKPEANTVIIVPNIKLNNKVETTLNANAYKVRAKETIYGISKQFGITVDDLIAANPALKNGLKKGMYLTIPPATIKADANAGFVLHKVVKDDTLYNLKKRYDVSEEELFQLNPQLENGLKLGMVLRIEPISESDDEVFDSRGYLNDNFNTRKQINVAVMLPYYTNKVEQVENIERYLKNENSLLSIVLESHMGIDMAIDSLRKQGVDVKVKYFDTENSGSKLQRILNTNNFNNTDLVIGPMFFDKAHWLSKKIDVPVVSPVYSKKQNSLNSANLIKSAPNDIILEERLVNYLREEYDDEKIIIVTDKSADANTQVLRMMAALNQFSNKVEVVYLPNNNGSSSNFNEKFVANEEHWVIFASNNEETKSVAINYLEVLGNQFEIQLFSPFNEDKFSNDNNSNVLGMLEFTYPTYQFINDQSTDVKQFFSAFKAKNHGYPSKYAIRAFDVAYDAIARIASEGNFKKGLRAGKSERVSSIFDYRKKMFEGFENNGVYLIKNNKDLSTELLD